MKHHTCARFAPLFLAALVVAAAIHPLAAEETEAGAKLTGKIVSTAGDPISGSTVMAYHLSTEKIYTATTSPKGEYVFTDLPYGYFDLAVDTPDGLYVGNQVVNLPPSGKAAVNLTVSQFTDTGSGPYSQPRNFPGTEQESAGLARVNEKLRGADFWRSPKGVAILAGSGGAVLLAIAGGSSSSGGSASTFVPPPSP